MRSVVRHRLAIHMLLVKLLLVRVLLRVRSMCVALAHHRLVCHRVSRGAGSRRRPCCLRVWGWGPDLAGAPCWGVRPVLACCHGYSIRAQAGPGTPVSSPPCMQLRLWF